MLKLFPKAFFSIYGLNEVISCVRYSGNVVADPFN